MEIEVIELRKDFLRNKTMANLMYYMGGTLYYTVEYKGDMYKFPIYTTENDESGQLKLSSDLGTTEFLPVVRASELNRWIVVAIKNDQFMKLQ